MQQAVGGRGRAANRRSLWPSYVLTVRLYYYLLFDLVPEYSLGYALMIIPTAGLPEQAELRRKYGISSSLNWTDIKDKCGDEVEMGQINNYTVHMILAKMYLNHNAWFDDHSDDSYYRKCVDELNVIIES